MATAIIWDTTPMHLINTAARITESATNYGERWGYWPGCGTYKVFLGTIPELAGFQSDPDTLEIMRGLLRTGLLTFARADLVAAMPDGLVASSEWVLDRISSYHFLLLSE